MIQRWPWPWNSDAPARFVVHNLHQLLRRLAEAGLDFVVVGGYAGVLHGSSLLTSDLDICAVLTRGNIEKLRGVLSDLHPTHRMTTGRLSFLTHPQSDTPVANLYLETDAGIVDILSNVLGVGDYHRLKHNAVSVPLFGRNCAVISLEDLITAKEAVGREKDLLAVKELRAIAARRQGKP
jgi:predicted nucleotidyltransferase